MILTTRSRPLPYLATYHSKLHDYLNQSKPGNSSSFPGHTVPHKAIVLPSQRNWMTHGTLLPCYRIQLEMRLMVTDNMIAKIGAERLNYLKVLFKFNGHRCLPPNLPPRFMGKQTYSIRCATTLCKKPTHHSRQSAISAAHVSDISTAFSANRNILAIYGRLINGSQQKKTRPTLRFKVWANELDDHRSTIWSCSEKIWLSEYCTWPCKHLRLVVLSKTTHALKVELFRQHKPRNDWKEIGCWFCMFRVSILGYATENKKLAHVYQG